MLTGEYPVDVIVPVYNIEKFVDKCINSIIKQTYNHVNIILVDDGSTDHSGSICDKYISLYKNIQVIHQENRGLVSAWKTGIRNSKAEWIVFVDGDDWIEEHHIETLVKEQLQSHADIVVGPMKQVKGHSSHPLKFEIPTGRYCGDRLVNELYPVMLNVGGFEKRGIPVSRCGKLIKKSLIINNMDYCQDSVTFEEDLCIIFISELDAKAISIIDGDDAAYCYSMVESSMLHSYNSKMNTSIKNVFASIYQACITKKKLAFIPQVRTEYLCAMIRNTTNELVNPNGFRAALKRIRSFSDDEHLQNALAKSSIKNFPIRFKLVTKTLKNIGTNTSKLILSFLYMAVQLRRKIH